MTEYVTVQLGAKKLCFFSKAGFHTGHKMVRHNMVRHKMAGKKPALVAEGKRPGF